MVLSPASTAGPGGAPESGVDRAAGEGGGRGGAPARFWGSSRVGIALTMFGGSSMVSPDSSWGGGQINVASDEIIPYLQEFSQRIHGHGAAIMCQISHLGRRADAMSMNWLPTLGPSRVRE